MCFSPEASFGVGAALLPVGAYCLRSSWRKNRALLPLAVVPLLLGVQQVSEGFVWLALQADDLDRARAASLVFLFFALALWPFWLPVCAAVGETRPARKRWLTAFAALTAGWFWVLYYPLLADPGRLVPGVMHHSIRYEFVLPTDAIVPRTVLRVLYLLSIVVPCLVGPRLVGPLPGILLGGAAVVAAVAFEHAFASVWCFFAAALSLALCHLFARLPGREPAPAPEAPQLRPS